MASPKVLLCDEPTSALDVSVQAQVLYLLLALQRQHGFGCVVVTHDLAVARVLADHVLLLRDGAVVEMQRAELFFNHPGSEYGKQLLEATRAAEPRRERAGTKP